MSNSNRTVGAPPPEAAAQFHSKMESMQQLPYAPSNLYLSNNVDEMALRNAMTFPARPFNKDPRDTMVQVRQDMVQQGMITPSRPMPYTQSEIQYYLDKQTEEEMAKFDAWFENRIAKMTDLELANAKRVNPEWFRRRGEVIREQVNMQLDYALLKLNGIQSLEDLYKEYAIETGLVEISPVSVHDPWKWNLANAGVTEAELIKRNPEAIRRKLIEKASKTYNAGLFSPWKTFTPANAPRGQNQLLPVDPSGDPYARAVGPFGVVGPVNSNVAQMYKGRDLGKTERSRLTSEDTKLFTIKDYANQARPPRGAQYEGNFHTNFKKGELGGDYSYNGVVQANPNVIGYGRGVELE